MSRRYIASAVGGHIAFCKAKYIAPTKSAYRLKKEENLSILFFFNIQ